MMNLYNSAASTCKFLWWIVTDLSMLSLFILLFNVLLRHSHTKGQELKCDIMNDFMITLSFVFEINFETLARAWSF